MKAEAIARRLSKIVLRALMMLTAAVLAPRSGGGMKDKHEMETIDMEKMAPQGMLSGTEGHRASIWCQKFGVEIGRARLGGGR